MRWFILSDQGVSNICKETLGKNFVDLKTVEIDPVASSAYLNFGWNKASFTTKINRSNSLRYQFAIDSVLD